MAGHRPDRRHRWPTTCGRSRITCTSTVDSAFLRAGLTVLLLLTFVWFLVACVLLVTRRPGGVPAMVSFLVVETLFYLVHNVSGAAGRDLLGGDPAEAGHRTDSAWSLVGGTRVSDMAVRPPRTRCLRRHERWGHLL